MAAVLVDRFGEAGKSWQVLVVEDTELAREALTDRLDMGCAGHGQAEAAFGPHCEPSELVVTERAVRVALQIRERRQHEAVLHGRAMGERERRMKRCHSPTIASPLSPSSLPQGKLSCPKYPRQARPCARGNPDSLSRSWTRHRR